MDTVDVSQSASGVAEICLNRPPVNAINRQMQREIRECFLSLSSDPSTRVVVLSAVGTRVFSPGADHKEMLASRRAGAMNTLDVLEAGASWRETQHAVRACSVPVIAAVEGMALADGFALLALCDLVIASESATFALNEIDVGLLGGVSKILRMVGPAKARSMLFGAKALTADELYRIGAIEEVVPTGGAVSRARSIAEDIARKSPVAIRLAKELVLRIEGDALDEHSRTEQAYSTRLCSFDDSLEALMSVLEHRAPTWS
jgi:enoyl-CoA hydratase